MKKAVILNIAFSAFYAGRFDVVSSPFFASAEITEA